VRASKAGADERT